MNPMNLFKRNPEKQQALRIANQSAQMYDYAAWKGGMSVRGRTKAGYKRRNKIKGKFCPIQEPLCSKGKR